MLCTATPFLRCKSGHHRPLAQQSNNHHPSRLQHVSASKVQVVFTDVNITTVAQPGQPISEVASACGVELHYGCFTGSCGVCEMELRKFDEDKEGGSVVVRTCVAVVPSGYTSIQLAEMDDTVWGMDGFDT